jgi:PIN domain nuclease of toxin-antitoxin system
MQYLLDTHVLLWWLIEPDKLKPQAREIIQDKSNLIFVSSVSFWEMAIKKGLGRLTFPHNLLEVVTTAQFKTLPIMPEEGLGVADLPLLHADPFDRLLIIQAKLHGLVLMTRDAQFSEYPVVCFPA